MAASATSLEFVQKMFLAYFGRPVIPTGQEYYGQLVDAGKVAALKDDFWKSAESQALFGNLSTEASVNAIFNQLFGRDAAVAGLTYWSTEIKAGRVSLPDAALTILNSAAGADLAVFNAKLSAANAFSAALDTTAEILGYQSNINGGRALLADVKTQTQADAVIATIDATVASVISGGSASQNTIPLTNGPDFVTGSSGKDTFFGLVSQNQDGSVSNTLSTGDRIDGGANVDKIVATLIHDRTVDAGAILSINPRTENVEEAHLEILDENITIDAGRMDSVSLFVSDNSDANLTIEDVRLGSKLAITKDITFGLRQVDTNSGLTAMFDSNSLVAQGASTNNSRLLVRIADVSTATPATPLKNVNMTLGFTLGTTAYTLENLRADTYDGLITAVQAALAAKGLGGLTVAAGSSYTQVTVAGNTVTLPFTAKEVLITDPAGSAFSAVNFTQNAIDPVAGGFLVAGNAAPVAPTVVSNLIETNVILDDAGRGSTAGDVIIGGMSNSNKAVQKANVIVDRSSKIDELSSATNMKAGAVLRAFEQIEVTSTGAKGNLSIGEVYNTKTFNSSAFEGATLAVKGTVLAAQEGQYTYTTSGAADTVNLVLNNDAIDKLATGVSISTGAGNDAITLNNNGGTLSQATMRVLDNAKIDAGSGNDTVLVQGNQRVVITSGEGNDFVHIDSTNANGVGHNALTGSWNVGQNTGAQTFVARVLYQADLTVVFAGFESKVKVQTDAAGNFVATQKTINDAIKAAIAASPELTKLLTVTNSTNDQQIIIRSNVGGENDLAIAIYQPTLVAAGAGANQVNAPTGADLVALEKGLINTTAGTSANFGTSAGLINEFNAGAGNALGLTLVGNVGATGAAGAGAPIDLTAAIGGARAIYADFTTGGSTDATAGANRSVVDAGTGNDLVVFHSNDAVANVLKISSAFDKTSVVNFHNLSPNDMTVGAGNAAQVGFHAIDFTSFLNVQHDPSAAPVGNQNSVVNVPITLNIPAIAQRAFTDSVIGTPNAVTNSVNMLRMDETAVGSVKFADLTAAQLVSALNTAPGAGVPVLGNINNTTLDAANFVIGGSTLVGTTLKYIVMVENVQNVGEYKVFMLTATANATTGVVTGNLFDTATAQLLGTLDFGASINFNLVGSDDWSLLTTGLKLDGTADGARFAALGGQTLDALAQAAAPVPAPAAGNELLTTAAAFNTQFGVNTANGTMATAQADTIVVAAPGHLAGSVLNGLGSTDTVKFATGGTFDLTSVTTFTEIENMEVLAGQTVNLSATQANNLQIANAGTVNVTGAIAATTYTFAETGAGAFNVAMANGTIAAGSNFGGAAVTTSGGDTVVGKTALGTMASLNVGANNVTLTGATGNDLVTDLAKLTATRKIVDFAAATTLTATAVNTNFGTIADAGVVATAADTITITNLISGNNNATEADDTFVFLADTTGAAIVGFDAGATNDKLDFTAFLGGAASVANAGTGANFVAAGLDLSGAANVGIVFNATAGIAPGDIQTGAATSKIAVEDNGKAVVLVNADTDGNGIAGDDWSVYYVEDTDTGAGQTWAVTLVGTLVTNASIDTAAEMAAAAAYV